MTRLNENIVESRVDTPISVLGDTTTSPPVKTKKEVYTLEEILSEFPINPFTLKEALEVLMISESEFKRQLDSKGLCKAKDFSKKQEFPVEWIRVLDTGKWKSH